MDLWFYYSTKCKTIESKQCAPGKSVMQRRPICLSQKLPRGMYLDMLKPSGILVILCRWSMPKKAMLLHSLFTVSMLLFYFFVGSKKQTNCSKLTNLLCLPTFQLFSFFATTSGKNRAPPWTRRQRSPCWSCGWCFRAWTTSINYPPAPASEELCLQTHCSCVVRPQVNNCACKRTVHV